MSFPLIILGAGASLDSIQVERFSANKSDQFVQWRPPVLKNLFDLSRFQVIIDKYPEIYGLVEDISNKIERKDFDLEEYLRKIEIEIAPRNPQRYKQLIAFRFFIAELFKIISVNFFDRANNYQVLLNEIEDKGSNPCFVNFNYDLILEKTLGINQERIDDYINGKIKVIKIHGAANWVYTPDFSGFNEYTNAYQFYLNSSEKISSLLKEKKPHELIQNNNSKYVEAYNHGMGYYLPAVALPVASKGNYVCPDTHIKLLESYIPHITSIIMIGWRANDNFLLNLIDSNSLAMDIPTVVVSSNGNNANEIIKKLRPISSLKLKASESKGFTDFLKSGEYENYI